MEVHTDCLIPYVQRKEKLDFFQNLLPKAGKFNIQDIHSQTEKITPHAVFEDDPQYAIKSLFMVTRKADALS